jgi:nucleotide-binding universal stress UspA family protein
MVLGSHGANASIGARGGLGRTVSTVLRGAAKPLLITREAYRPIRKVVVGWDGHPDAAHAAEMVFGLAKDIGWRVLVVSGTEGTSMLAESCDYLAGEMRSGGVEAQSFIEPGNAPEIIFRAVNKFAPDLVAIGGRQKSPGRQLIRGNAWWDLVEQLSVPVLLYR